MFLSNKAYPSHYKSKEDKKDYINEAIKNKVRYSKLLEKCNEKLRNPYLGKEERAELLIEKGNCYLRLIPTRADRTQQINFKDRGYKCYELAYKITLNSKHKKDLFRAIEQIKHKSIERLLNNPSIYVEHLNPHLFYYGFISVLAFLLSIFFSSTSLTGNAVAERADDFNILGLCFFLCGLALAMMCFRRNSRRKNL